MPKKNRPKRLHRNRSWQVARRKRKMAELASGGGRNRKPRPKNKGAVTPAQAENIISKIAAVKTEKKEIIAEKKPAKKDTKKDSE